MSNVGQPKRLFKYRPFNERTVEMLSSDQIYFSNPRNFNDPLDVKPVVNTDLNLDDLKQVLQNMIEQRIEAEMKAAAKIMKYRGPKTSDHIMLQALKGAQKSISNLEYLASDADSQEDEQQIISSMLGFRIEGELSRRYAKGIFALAANSDCALMWSHYGQEHKGVCIGYDVPLQTQNSLFEVKYGGSRLIKASLIEKMLNGDTNSQKDVDERLLLTKAETWRYEREWRLIGEQGIQNSHLEIQEIIFGMRCPETTKYSIVKLLEDRGNKIGFKEIYVQGGGFVLQQRKVDLEQLLRDYPRRSLDSYEAFDNLN